MSTAAGLARDAPPAAWPPLVDVLAELLVPPEHVAFLQALLLRGETARAAWARWRGAAETIEDPATPAGRWVKTFAPLVLRAVEREQLPVPPRAVVTLRAWRLTEAERDRRYRVVLGDVLRRLGREGIGSVMLNGLALAETVYPDPLLRHCHDIDLLVPDLDARRCELALAPSGFARARGDAALVLVHPSGLPVSFHRASARVPYYRVPVEAIVSTATPQPLVGTTIAVASRTHLLVHACLQGLAREPGASSARWAVDAWHLLGANERPDWSEVVTLAEHHGFALPLAVTLAFLSRLGAAVPGYAIDALTRPAVSSYSNEVRALVPLLPAAPRRLRDLRRLAHAGTARLAVALAMALPSARFMRWHYGAHAPGGLVSLHVSRLARRASSP